VYPDPALHFSYFWPETVVADVPFSVVLVLSNRGFGTARSVVVSSAEVRAKRGPANARLPPPLAPSSPAPAIAVCVAQPRILENHKLLLVRFQLAGVSVNGGAVLAQTSVLVGDLGPSQAVTVVWLLTSSLNGTFDKLVRIGTILMIKAGCAPRTGCEADPPHRPGR
jgi:hypothetical protein